MGVELLAAAFLFLLIGYRWFKGKKAGRAAFITTYPFPPALARKVREKYPHLSDDQVDLVLEALRDYFHICNQAGKRMVSMPSQVVDVAWHEFILFTRTYGLFCRKALGRFLHHTPTEAMSTPTLAQEGIKRAWRLACAREHIDPSSPTRLPRLFAIDAELEISDGFRYALNCRDPASPAYGQGYCAAHIGCASGCGGDSGAVDSGSGGFFDSFGDSSDGCGGGCGGD